MRLQVHGALLTYGVISCGRVENLAAFFADCGKLANFFHVVRSAHACIRAGPPATGFCKSSAQLLCQCWAQLGGPLLRVLQDGPRVCSQALARRILAISAHVDEIINLVMMLVAVYGFGALHSLIVYSNNKNS
jgi:hypothetical protein